MNNIVSLFNNDDRVKEVLKTIDEASFALLISNTTLNHNYLLAYATFLKTNNFVVYVASNLYQATLAYEAFCKLLGFQDVCFYAVDEIVAAELLAVSSEFRFERIHTLEAIYNNSPKIIVTHTNAVARPIFPKDNFMKHIINLKEKEVIDMESFINSLVTIGYKKVPITQTIGSFSVRGEVIDIFPINQEEPVRIDLFDNEIEYLKIFDPETQKTTKPIKELKIFPINEIIYDNPEEVATKIAKNINNSEIEKDLEDIKNYNNIERLHKYIKYFTNEVSNIFEYMEAKTVFFEDIKKIKDNYEKTILELNEYLNTKEIYKHLNLCFYNDFYSILHNNKQMFLTQFKQSLNDIQLSQIIDLAGYMVIDYQNDIKNFLTDLVENKKTFIITMHTEQSLGLLKEIFSERQIKYNECKIFSEIVANNINIILVENALSFGFINTFEVIDEEQIFKKMKLKKTKYRSAYQNTIPINSKEELQPNDYIVHYDYGIGKYLGIKTVELGDIKNDYILLQFANMELYIPVENINLLEKYQASEGVVPKLTNIGTNEWEKKKAKVREKLESIAKELIAVQAVREEKKGYKYQEDDEIQEQFENDFEFQETPDQLKTVEEIKRDMEEGIIVDRLVCGDVGYGKTEIAMRIALKTVLNNKQVAYLAPTTILTRQHYYSFKERFAKYGIRVEVLNRFIEGKKEKEILEGLKKGSIDIVIGTHKLLNEGIVYKDLGLLIVDEEQRFGVTHKEKIKQYKNNINVITLTATPIPRTLQMSIMGIRQLSLIETPPQNRYPVQTYVLEENKVVIKEAIYREIGRGGQVFYLHNRISDLDMVYRKLQRLVPEARILVAHGKMDKLSLEEAMEAFIDKEFDVLLCTTIIETGIDIPNTNTLIVDMADRLGLAQMYQIRGRVGRSDRVSYAYFMFEEDKVLTDAGTKRLNAIKEFTTLGSGYRIAVRDLAIRGAGDILGREQSGFIDSVGLDLYMKLLSEAINKIKGEEVHIEEKKNWNVEVSNHVSNNYVSDDDIKIYIHKKIAQIKTKTDKENIILELTDRFGRLSKEIKLYIDKKYMDSLLTQMGVETLREKDAQIEIVFSQDASNRIDASKLVAKGIKEANAFFEYRNKKIIMEIPKTPKEKIWIKKLINVLESFCI